MTVPFELTKDGYERQWQVKYLSPFLMTTLLLPLLLSAASRSQRRDRVRMVNVASDMAFALGPKKIEWEGKFNKSDAALRRLVLSVKTQTDDNLHRR